MKEHKIPIQLSKYAHFIVGGSRDILDIDTEPYIFSSNSNPLSFINSNIDPNNSNNQFLASINLSEIKSIFSIEDSNAHLNINLSVCFPNFYKTKKNTFIPIENSFEISNFDLALNYYQKNINKIYLTSNYEFCPLNLKDESDFYYGYFLENLNYYEKNIFLQSNKFIPKNNKIGGFNPFPNIELYSNNPFDFSEPLIPLMSINNKLLGVELELSLVFFAKQTFFNNWKDEKILSFICIS